MAIAAFFASLMRKIASSIPVTLFHPNPLNKKVAQYQIFSLYSSLLLILAISVIFPGCNTPGNFNGESGFVPIFNGIDLDDWAYDSAYWHIQDGVLVGEITSETLLERNSFIIWEGGQVEYFELKVEYGP